MTDLTKRTERFWEWFSKNEEKLSEITEKKGDSAEETVGLVSKGVSLISDGLQFNIGGDHEFTFAVNGDYALFFILPYVTSNLPEEYRSKWSFFPCMQGTKGESFGIKMFDTSVNGDKVMVSASVNENKTADIRFHAKEWIPLDENKRYTVFFIMMDVIIGEALSNICVGSVKWADGPADGMFPLTKLEEWIKNNVCEDGKVPDPVQRVFGYERKPDGDYPRGDIFAGYSSYMRFLNEYQDGVDKTYQRVMGLGAKPIFLYYYYDGKMPGEKVLDERQVIIDDLEGKVLGRPGSGKEIGIVQGAASSKSRVYIDLLLYDENAFMEKARKVFADSPHMIFGKEFCREGKEFVLTDQTVPGYRDRLELLHNIRRHRGVIEAIESLPPEKVDFDLNGLYARALNNDDQKEKALTVLGSVRELGENDALWNWRMGYALYYLLRFKESVPYLQKASVLGGPSDALTLLKKAQAILRTPEIDAERRAAKVPRDPKKVPFEGFDIKGFWDESNSDGYKGGPASDKQFEDVERILGHKLPASYKMLMGQSNGGIPVRRHHSIDMPTPWMYRSLEIDCIMGVDPSIKFSLLGELGTKFMLEKGGFPDIGIAICTVSGVRDLVFLDYRHCGPDGEPEVALVDPSWNYEVTWLADNFESFVRELVKEEELE